MKSVPQAAALCIFFVLRVVSVPAQPEVTGLQKQTLANGMELFILENHIVPLARIQITFRCGAIAQGPLTAGLFHLYEHMLFKGNRVFRSQSEFQAAMKELGVTSWNGGTSNESVSYFFTVPSDKMAKGIEFWANAVRYPLFNPAELETEKNVVMNEVQGYLNDPGNIFMSGVEKALFWKYPWRKDVTGYEKTIRGAHVQLMRDIQNTHYIPNNAALFVGGDVNPEEVRAAAQKYFGDWVKRPNPWARPLAPQAPLPKNVLLVYPDEQMYGGLASVNIELRGPDVSADPGATYAADVWGMFLDDPNGRFKANIFSKVPGLYKKEYISASYATQRDGGRIGFSTYAVVPPKGDTFTRLSALKTAFMEEMSAIAQTPAYFSPKDYEVLKTKLADMRVLERETADGFIGSLSFWWATAGTPYYLGYVDNLKRIGFTEIRKYLFDYVIGKNSVMSVRMNPEDFKKEKEQAVKAGYTILSKDNAYWWAEK